MDSGQVRDLTVSHHEFKEVLHHKKSWAFETVFIRKDLFLAQRISVPNSREGMAETYLHSTGLGSRELMLEPEVGNIFKGSTSLISPSTSQAILSK